MINGLIELGIKMFHWRITKYNPTYRSNKAVYSRNEWTSFSDIGKEFDGKILTLDDYLKAENKYIQAIILFMDCLNLDELQIIGLEKGGKQIKELSLIDGTEKIINKQFIYKNHLNVIVQLILRDKCWAKLESKKMYVHFGYDYYMYIGSSNSCESTIKLVEQNGLFVEEYKSPYLEK